MKKPNPARPVSLGDNGDVLDAEGKLITDNPRAGRYQWIKLDVPGWLGGTTRWLCTDAQRAFWIDLLCLSANGRFPGWVCAGQDAGKMIGYPWSWYRAHQADPTFDVEGALTLFETQGKVRIHITRKDEPTLVAVEIVNWSKFQSDIDYKRALGALRAKRWRKNKKKRSHKK
jgi:hypothetical protein